MLAFASLLKRNKRGNLTEKDVRKLEIIDNNGRRLNVLIQDLLDVSRMDMGNLALEPVEFDINECVTDLVESFYPIYDTKQQKLLLEMPAISRSIYADKNRVTRVLTNLLSNASKYSPEDKRVWLKVADVDGHLEFEVRDEGVGISEENQKQMFTAFYRVDTEQTRSIEGTGLGLVIAKGIVEIHGGEMRMDSKLGVGTSFKFDIDDLVRSDDDSGTSSDQQAAA